MISDATILYLSAVDWDAPWHGPQELAKRMGAAGNHVVYVETVGWRRPRLFDARRVLGRAKRAAQGSRSQTRRTEPSPGVQLVSPLLIPGAGSSPERSFNRRRLLSAVRPLIGNGRPLILWIYTPAHLTNDLIGALDEDLCIYHCTQHHAGRPHAPKRTPELERQIMARADLVIADGILLYEERERLHPRVYRIPSGVDSDSLAETEPASWAGGMPRPIVGYMGSIDHRIDPDLIATAARAHPEWSFVAVGPIVDIDVSTLSALPNVALLGQVPISEVPRALAAFDVGLMPYANIEMTRYTYPAKLHQYLAAGLPIISTPLPDLEEFADLVRQASTATDFVTQIEQALDAPRLAPKRRAVASEHTWAARAEAISALISAHLEGNPPSSSSDFRA